MSYAGAMECGKDAQDTPFRLAEFKPCVAGLFHNMVFSKKVLPLFTLIDIYFLFV